MQITVASPESQTDTVLCVNHDAVFELRRVVGYEKREDIHHTVAVPRMSPDEHALWLSCDDGKDRWYIYHGALIAEFHSRHAPR